MCTCMCILLRVITYMLITRWFTPFLPSKLVARIQYNGFASWSKILALHTLNIYYILCYIYYILCFTYLYTQYMRYRWLVSMLSCCMYCLVLNLCCNTSYITCSDRLITIHIYELPETTISLYSCFKQPTPGSTATHRLRPETRPDALQLALIYLANWRCFWW